MNYRSYKYREGDFGLQEVIEELRFDTKWGRFTIKLVRTPNIHRPVSYNPLVCEGEDYRHNVYAMYVTKGCGRMLFNDNRPQFPDSQEGFDAAVKRFNSLLWQFHKYKNLTPPKKWPMFKKS